MRIALVLLTGLVSFAGELQGIASALRQQLGL